MDVYTDYQFELWPDTFASTEKAQGEFFEEDEKIGLKKAWNFYNNRFHDEYFYQKIFNQCTGEK